jgi:hypothetical protein
MDTLTNYVGEAKRLTELAEKLHIYGCRVKDLDNENLMIAIGWLSEAYMKIQEEKEDIQRQQFVTALSSACR